MTESPELDNIIKKGNVSYNHYCKRSRPDILLAVSYLTTRVTGPNVSDFNKLQRVLKHLNGPNVSDFNKLQRVLKHLNGSKNLTLTLYGDGSSQL